MAARGRLPRLPRGLASGRRFLSTAAYWPPRRHWLAPALALLGLLVAVSTRADVLGEVRTRGALRVGVLNEAPPYSFRNPDGARLGLEPALAQDIARTLGARLELVPVELVNRIDALLNGEVDVVLAGLQLNAQITRVVELIHPPYYASGSNILARKQERFTRWTDLAGVRVCTIQGAPHNERLAGDYGAELMQYKASTEAYEALIAGTCRAFAYTDAALVTLLRRDERWQDYEMPLDTLDETPWVMAIRPGDALFSAVLSGLALRWHRSGKLAELEDQWRIRRTPFIAAARDIYD